MKPTLLLVLVLTLLSCAEPQDGIEGRIRALKSRGADTTALEQELRHQTDKFALFRSYKLADDMLAQLESGKAVAAASGVDFAPGSWGSISRYEDAVHGVVCYTYNVGGIWCEHTTAAPRP